jgi:hypothetical protein
LMTADNLLTPLSRCSQICTNNGLHKETNMELARKLMIPHKTTSPSNMPSELSTFLRLFSQWRNLSLIKISKTNKERLMSHSLTLPSTRHSSRESDLNTLRSWDFYSTAKCCLKILERPPFKQTLSMSI